MEPGATRFFASSIHEFAHSSVPADVGGEVVVEARNGKAVRLTVPAAGFVVYE